MLSASYELKTGNWRSPRSKNDKSLGLYVLRLTFSHNNRAFIMGQPTDFVNWTDGNKLNVKRQEFAGLITATALRITLALLGNNFNLLIEVFISVWPDDSTGR